MTMLLPFVYKLNLKILMDFSCAETIKTILNTWNFKTPQKPKQSCLKNKVRRLTLPNFKPTTELQ
jgi:hypothetical protein